MKKIILKLINYIIATLIFFGGFIGLNLLLSILADKISVYFLTFVVFPVLLMISAIID